MGGLTLYWRPSGGSPPGSGEIISRLLTGLVRPQSIWAASVPSLADWALLKQFVDWLAAGQNRNWATRISDGVP